MKYIIRFFKILFIGIIALFIGYPFSILMMFVAIFSIFPLMGFLYIKTGNKDSFDKACDIAFGKILEEFGFIPFKWCNMLMKE